MIPIPRPPLTHKQKALALTVAGVADFLQIMLLPALLPGYVADDAIDVIVAIILTGVCGFKWQFALVFFIELVPMLDLLPTWSAVVLTLPSVPGDTVRPPMAHDPRRTGAEHAPLFVTAIPVPPVQPRQNRTNC